MAQSISPGMVDTDLLNVYDSTVYAQLPKLNPADVTSAVLYALSTSEYVQVNYPGCNDRCIFNRPKTDGECLVWRIKIIWRMDAGRHRLTIGCLFRRSRRLFWKQCSNIEWAHRTTHQPTYVCMRLRLHGEKWIVAISCLCIPITIKLWKIKIKIVWQMEITWSTTNKA